MLHTYSISGYVRDSEAPPELHLNYFDVKDGKQSRRERRANERKSNGTQK